jgi:Ser/Thr protein kinase RdoA (MazF antagonist)
VAIDAGRASRRVTAVESPRQVTLVLCRGDGTVLGSLPRFTVEAPWWQEVGPVVDGARRHHGVDVVVLRLLAAERDRPHGGAVTYLAEVADGAPVPAVEQWVGDLTTHPLRLPWAEPGGPAADLAWADEVLAGRGTPRSGPAVQVRTWNLSSLWRLPLDGGAAWLKVVPPFFAHEGEVIARLRSPAAPPLLAAARPRVLLDEVPGEDLYEAEGPTLLALVRELVAVQRDWIARLGELEAIGAPDWRPAPLAEAVADVAERTADQLAPAVRQVIDGVLAAWDQRFAAVDACGVPDSIVHGDFHPGNARGDGDRLWLLDWGDCGIGHPLLDQAAFLSRVGDERAATAVGDEWARLWQEAVPGSDPTFAAELLGPVAALRQAVIYRRFLDRIEPAEQPYHRADPPLWLTRAAELATGRRV